VGIVNFRPLLVAALGLWGAACSDGGSPVTPPPGATSGSGGTASAGSSTGGGGTMAVAGGTVGGGGAGVVGGAGGTSGATTGGGGAGGAGGAPNLMPTKLSETGLFSDIKTQALAPGVFAFEPAYFLWSDGATKRRWVYMPPGGKILTDNMEYWQYPAGFKLWKEFSRDGKVIETRLLLKKSDGVTDWYMVAFKWNDDHSDALAVPDGEMNAMGTMHDIPNKDACTGCHGAMNDNALGFSALQLSHTKPNSLNLKMISDMGWLSAPPAAAGYSLPGTETEKAALGYLHANCGMCHNNFGKVYNTKASLDLWTHLDQIGTLQDTRAYLSMVCADWPGAGGKAAPITTCTAGHGTGAMMDNDISKLLRVVPKNATESGIHDLMSLRAVAMDSKQMPPLGTEIPDPTGLAAVDAWINGLP
jgi:hypothetical protein